MTQNWEWNLLLGGQWDRKFQLAEGRDKVWGCQFLNKGEFEEQGEEPSELAKQEVLSGQQVGARQPLMIRGPGEKSRGPEC